MVIKLTKKDHHNILSGKELSDLHVNAYQNLLETSFPSIHGFQNTLLQHKCPLLKHTDPCGQTLKVVHIRKSHWAALQIRSGNVELYDTAYTSASEETMHIIAQLVRCNDHGLTVHMMNVTKQSGTTDCGLYAAAILTCLTMNIDPSGIVFDRQELRQHFTNSLQNGKVSPFPIYKTRRVATRVLKEEQCPVYCTCSCRMPDNGEDAMICCDKCDEWLHYRCLQSVPPCI